MSYLKAKFENNMTNRDKENARFETEKLLRHLLELGFSFRVSSGKVGCFTVLIPDEADDHIRFYFAHFVQVWCANRMVYQADWYEHDYDKMMDVFVDL